MKLRHKWGWGRGWVGHNMISKVRTTYVNVWQPSHETLYHNGWQVWLALRWRNDLIKMSKNVLPGWPHFCQDEELNKAGPALEVLHKKFSKNCKEHTQCTLTGSRAYSKRADLFTLYTKPNDIFLLRALWNPRQSTTLQSRNAMANLLDLDKNWRQLVPCQVRRRRLLSWINLH